MNKKQTREKFRNDVFERDKHICRKCRCNDRKLDAHHITDRSEMPCGGYVAENGISLCDAENGCHAKAERYHITGGKEWEAGFHPNDLYEIIKSSKELAIEKSKLLCN